MPYVALQLGVKQVYPGRYEPEYLLDLIDKEGVTFSHCVPTILRMLLSSPRARQVDLSHWKVVVGGAALPIALAQEALRRGIDIFAGYGMSEACPVLTLAQLPPHLGKLDADGELRFRSSAGCAIPLVELRTVDQTESEPSTTGQGCGEIVVRAPWLTQGYLHQADASRYQRMRSNRS